MLVAPPGRTPRAVSVPARAFTASLIVPSPENTTTRSTPSSAAWAASSDAWPRSLVSETSSRKSADNAFSITASTGLDIVRATGLTTSSNRWKRMDMPQYLRPRRSPARPPDGGLREDQAPPPRPRPAGAGPPPARRQASERGRLARRPPRPSPRSPRSRSALRNDPTRPERRLRRSRHRPQREASPPARGAPRTAERSRGPSRKAIAAEIRTCTLRGAVIRIVLLSDRSPGEVLPATPPLLLEFKGEPLSTPAIPEALALEPDVVVVDAAENPAQGYAVHRALSERRPSVPVVAVLDRRDVDRFAWEEVADEVVYPGAPEGEIRLRFEMAHRRSGAGHEATIRLGPLSLDPGTFRVSLEGTPLDLTFKEFELLRFLAEHPGRVFTRPALMREVWGYDFYGGTRTVDVHVRRLRAKLGPAHEHLLETVRGVGYRAADV